MARTRAIPGSDVTERAGVGVAWTGRSARLSRRELATMLAASASTAALATSPLRAQGVAPHRNRSAAIDARADDLLARMTVEEKAAQLQGIWHAKSAVMDAAGMFSPAAAARAYPAGIGHICRPCDRIGAQAQAGPVVAGAAAGAVNRDAREAALWTSRAQQWARDHTRLGIPLLLHEEALHGLAARDATSFPQAIALASTWDPVLVERCFAVAAAEMRARGVNMALAPVVDVARDPRWGRSEETFGEDPYLVGEMGMAAVRGLQGDTLPLAPGKVFATLKHMAGHGMPENGTNTGPAEMGERTLRDVFLAPFERIVKSLPVRAIMPSYNEIDGVPSHANHWLLETVLRDEWGYQGITVSDYFAIRQLVERHHVAADLAAAARLALASGVDVELPDPIGYAKLPELVRGGAVPPALLDRAVRRVLRMKLEGGLFDMAPPDARRAADTPAAAAASALARTAAARAMVLLKNDGVLPLDPARHRRLLVVGTHARDTPIGGYSDTPRHVVSVLDGLRAERGFAVRYAEGVRVTRSRIWQQDAVELVPLAENLPLIDEAVRAAADADAIVVVLGENEELSREAWSDAHLGDRDALDLVGAQDRLAAALFDTGKPVVVLLLNGRPLSVNLLAERANALIEGWYLGQETGGGVADVLTGRIAPGGKLPVTIPRSVGQLPVHYDRKPSARRGYLFGETRPLFPFGHGLSYTSFTVSAPRLARSQLPLGEPVEVAVDVANTGARTGDETVQLYLRDEVASVTRPILQLKRFERVTLRPGERRMVRFRLEEDDFAFAGLDGRRRAEPGRFTLLAGPNSVELTAAALTIVERTAA